ncbi:MAG: hypothetical protein Q9196_002960 [Gyalolechia fulgens]
MSKRVCDPDLQHQLSSVVHTLILRIDQVYGPRKRAGSFTKSKASTYGLTGWVRNNANDQVEGEAQGDDEAIQKLLNVLESGPPAASVTKVDKSDIDVKEGESSFTVK